MTPKNMLNYTSRWAGRLCLSRQARKHQPHGAGKHEQQALIIGRQIPLITWGFCISFPARGS
jgi:hypothetical protein